MPETPEIARPSTRRLQNAARALGMEAIPDECATFAKLTEVLELIALRLVALEKRVGPPGVL